MIAGFGLALVDIQKHVVSKEMLQIGGVVPTANQQKN